MRPFFLRKIWNARLNRAEFKKVRTGLRSLPSIVYIDPTNLCNLRCALCPSGQRQIKPVGRMEMDTFRYIIDALGPTAMQLHLYNWGEPFLHPQIPEMITHAKLFGPEVIISTNLNKLEETTARSIIDAKLDRLNVSIDGVSQEIYEQYRVGGDIKQVLDNMRMLCQFKKEAKSRLPIIDWQFMVTRQNETELAMARNMAAELGVMFHTKKIRVGLAEFDTCPSDQMSDEKNTWLPKDSRYNRYSKNRNKIACKALWRHVAISWQGAVAPCCSVFKSSQNFADTFPNDFRSFWNGSEYSSARKIFTGEGDYEAKKLDLVCVNCAAAGNIL